MRGMSTRTTYFYQSEQYEPETVVISKNPNKLRKNVRLAQQLETKEAELEPKPRTIRYWMFTPHKTRHGIRCYTMDDVFNEEFIHGSGRVRPVFG